MVFESFPYDDNRQGEVITAASVLPSCKVRFVGIVGDLYTVVPKMIEQLKKIGVI